MTPDLQGLFAWRSKKNRKIAEKRLQSAEKFVLIRYRERPAWQGERSGCMRAWSRGLLGLLAAAMVTPLASAAPAEGGATSPADIQGHWAQEEIQRAMDAGWIDGYPDGTFQPEQTITRAEFTKLLLDAIHLTPDSETVAWMKGASQAQAPMEDMADHWLTEGGWMDAALVSGMVVTQDYNYHNFRPEKPIARYEIALMTTRALGQVKEGNQLLDSLDYTDDNTILPWMKGYVNEAVKAGVLHGYPDGSFQPHATSTRAEAVVMIQRMLDRMEEGVTDDVTVQVTCDNWGNERTVTLDDPTVQVVDGTLYVSARDALEGWDAAAEPYQCTLSWDPITQRIDGTFGGVTSFQAGSRSCTYDMLPAVEDLSASKMQLVAPARMLYGEVMIPVYSKDINPQEKILFNWLGGWDEETKTMTLPMKTPWSTAP